VELWKRKSAEINTRWGCIDLMEDEEAENRIIREGFSGDEEIYDVTGELTKY
jgi:anoctamin-8